MKNVSKLALSLVLIFSATLVLSQKRAKKGDYSFLKGQKLVNVIFDYSDMTIAKDKTEDEYVSEKVKELNEDEAGKGDKWKEGWFGAREKRYEPKFMTLINKVLNKKTGIKFEKGAADTKYTLKVHSTYTDPGWNVGVMKRPSFVNFTFYFLEGEKEIGKYTLENIEGSQAAGFDFDVGSRLAESYAKGGKILGKYIYKDVK